MITPVEGRNPPLKFFYMKVLVLKTFKAREIGKVVRPGQYLEYQDDRAAELAAGGWVEIVGEEEDTMPAAVVGIQDDGVPEVGDDTDEVGHAEKVERAELQPEKVEVNEPAAKAKRGRKAKSEK